VDLSQKTSAAIGFKRPQRHCGKNEGKNYGAAGDFFYQNIVFSVICINGVSRQKSKTFFFAFFD
jgi:hypothetical protein